MERVVSIEWVRVDGRHRHDLGDLESLAKSIAAIGLLHAIVVTPDGRLIAGRRRLEACRLLGWETVPAREASDLGDAVTLLVAERDENTERKPMAISELMSLAVALEALERPKAKARQGTRNDLTSGPAEPKDDGMYGRVATIVSGAVGLVPSQYKRAMHVYRVANNPAEDPELRQVARLALAGMDATGKISGHYDKVRSARRRKEEQRNTVEPLDIRATSVEATNERKLRLTELAASGMRADQIAQALGYASVDTVRAACARFGITIHADKVLGKTKKIDPNRVVRETVHALEGLSIGVQLVDVAALDPAEARGWASSIATSTRILNQLVRHIRERMP